MFSWNNNLLKMNVNKLFSHINLVKLQPSFEAKKIFSRIQLQNFSLSSCFSNKMIVDDPSKITFDDPSKITFEGTEHITSLQKISKKNNKLSKVEEKDIEVIKLLKTGDILYPFDNYLEKLKDFFAEVFKMTAKKGYYFLTKIDTGISSTQFECNTDILIIGGGAVGLTIAYYIKNEFPYGPQVTVVDKDSSFPHTSTNLGQGLVSLQMFNEEEEISILKYGIEFFSSFSRNTEIPGKIKFKLGYDPLGSLLLVDESNADKVLKNHELLTECDIYNKILTNEKLKELFPWLNVENILFGSLGMFGEGVVDPWAYIYGLKCKCVSLGVKFVTAEIIDFGFDGNSLRRAICKLPDGTYNYLNFSCCILAGGLESLNIVKVFNDVMEFFKLRLPLEERMRYEYCFYQPKGPGFNTPIIINSDGTYFRREGLTGHYVTGVPSVVSYEDNDKEAEPYQVFENKIKPFLIKRIPTLKKVDFAQGWIDVHDYCVSNNVGITGPHPGMPNLVFALGFSHLGLQYLPGLGRGIMEYLFYDSYKNINLEPFHIENLWRKQHLEVARKRKELLQSKQHVSLSNK